MEELHTQPQTKVCPISGESRPRKAPHYAKLYGQHVSRKCYFGFANRRQFAYLIDGLIWSHLVSGVGQLIGLDWWPWGPETISGTYILVFFICQIPFLFKDGFAGQSPGKALMGVQVLDERTGRPAGFLASFKRNLPLLIPLLPIYVAFKLLKGYRLGDKWANTKVVWKKYKDKAPFAV